VLPDEMVATLNVGCRVEGSHGEFLPAPCNPDGSQASRRKRARLQGTIVEAKGEKRWLIKFDNGLEKECPSVTLKLLRDPRYSTASAAIVSSSLPPIASHSNATTLIPSTSSASAHTTSNLSAASAPGSVPSAAIVSVALTSESAASESAASAPIASESAASAPIASESAASAPIASESAASAPTASELAASAPIASESAASAPTASELAASAPPAEILEAEDIDLLQAEDIDLLEVEDEIQNEDDDGDIFDMFENVTLDVYQQQRKQCEEKKLEIIESNWSVATKSGNAELVWKVIPDSIPDNPAEEFSSIGVRDFDWENFRRLSSNIKSSKKTTETVQPYLELFLLLWPGDWKKQLIQLNDEIQKDFKNKSKNKAGVRPIRPVTPNEFLVFIGIIIFAGAVGKGGKNLFEGEKDRQKEGVHLMSPRIDVTPHMPLRRFEDIKTYFPYAFADFEKKNPALPNHDPWYMLSQLVDEFNKNRSRQVAASVIKLLDETMSAWRPRKNKTGGLPNISFILRKPEPLGTEFKTMACSETGKLNCCVLYFCFIFFCICL
jgi:hypothetical protein